MKVIIAEHGKSRSFMTQHYKGEADRRAGQERSTTSIFKGPMVNTAV